MYHVLHQTVRLGTVLEPTARQQTVQTQQIQQHVYHLVNRIVQNLTVQVRTAR